MPHVASGRQGSRTLIPTCGNRLSRAARPTLSAYLPNQWTHRESNPGFSDCQPDAFPLDHEPDISGPPGSRTPISWLQARCLPVGPASPLFVAEVRPGFEPGLPLTKEVCRPKHLQTDCKMIPDGVEPSLSWLSPRRLCRWTTGSYSSDRRPPLRGGARSRIHKITRLSTSSLYQFAYPAVLARLPHRAPSCRFGCRTRRSGLMRPS
jgi:hypothetical protein